MKEIDEIFQRLSNMEAASLSMLQRLEKLGKGNRRLRKSVVRDILDIQKLKATIAAYRALHN